MPNDGERCRTACHHGRQPASRHATVSITLDVSSHCMPTDGRAAATKVASLILGA